MNIHSEILKDNDWICDYVIPCGSLFLLATNSYQKGCKDIKELIWRLYLNYCPLNNITPSFELSIHVALLSSRTLVIPVVIFTLSH